MIKSRKQSFIVIGVFALVLMLGTVTYAFFNYTRTGTANTIRTGRISFNTTQSNTLNLTNVFPMSATDAGNANLDAVSVRIQGDTPYADGEEFEISIVDVNNTIGSGASAKTIPINYIASYSATPVQEGDPNVIGTNSDSYFTARGQSSAVYQLSAIGEATNGEQVLIGFIPSGATGIDGTLTIKAYLDSSKIVISDTYNDGNTPTDNMGTPASFGEGKTVLTTTEWNVLQNTQTPLSFKIKAVSQEGTWVPSPAPLAATYISSLLTDTNTAGNKIYTGSDPDNYVWFNNEQWRIIGVYDDKLKIIKATPSTTAQVYDSDASSNVWSGSTMQSNYLYNTYWPTLSATAQGMIEQSATWDVGVCESNIAASAAYACASEIKWQGKIGLIATYEYLYGAENDGTCWSQSGGSYDGYGGLTVCKAKDWIFSTVTNNGSTFSWTISPKSSNGEILIVRSGGYISAGSRVDAYATSPVVYLDSTITITGGNGKSGQVNSYKLG